MVKKNACVSMHFFMLVRLTATACTFYGKYNSYDNECPVKNLKKEEEADSLRSPKLDYLLEDDRENIYFVELKT